MNATGTGGLDPKIGTILVGVVNFISSITAILPVKTFNRKPLMVAGHGALSVILFLVGLCSYFELNTGVLVLILI